MHVQQWPRGAQGTQEAGPRHGMEGIRPLPVVNPVWEGGLGPNSIKRANWSLSNLTVLKTRPHFWAVSWGILIETRHGFGVKKYPFSWKKYYFSHKKYYFSMVYSR